MSAQETTTEPPTDNSIPTEHTDVLGKRIVAQILDLIAISFFSFIAAFFIGFISGLVSPGSELSGVATAFIYLAMFCILFAYNIGLEGYWNGQTLGKKLIGIKVVKENGDEIDWGSAIVRNIPGIFSFGALAYLVALLSIAMTDHRQRLFDTLANTVVVDADHY